ncbi:MAG: archaeosine biosynthesis radical SAM protein RaSEA [Candidatus Hodarchaeales archaeon]|jgi:radical SAM enzyme (TIGR01210 family)
MEKRLQSSIRQLIAQGSKDARIGRPSSLIRKKEELRAKTWIQESPLGDSFVIILPTRGCSWALSQSGGCTVCGFLEDTYQGNANHKATQMHFQAAIESIPSPPPKIVKLFNSGSFFDEQEIPEWLCREILRKIEETEGIEQLIVESRPEFIGHESLEIAKQELQSKNLTIAIGLETSNDSIRRDCINKGFTLSEFERAIETISEFGFRKKAYLLLKPPFLTEAEAISDCVSSAVYAESIGVEEISINPVNIQRKTLLERLWRKGYYRPPWLWSLLWVVEQIISQSHNLVVLCEPVAAGTSRGVQNCGQCDKDMLRRIRKAIPDHWASMGPFECECHSIWRSILENDAVQYGLDFF